MVNKLLASRGRGSARTSRGRRRGGSAHRGRGGSRSGSASTARRQRQEQQHHSTTGQPGRHKPEPQRHSNRSNHRNRSSGGDGGDGRHNRSHHSRRSRHSHTNGSHSSRGQPMPCWNRQSGRCQRPRKRSRSRKSMCDSSSNPPTYRYLGVTKLQSCRPPSRLTPRLGRPPSEYMVLLAVYACASAGKNRARCPVSFVDYANRRKCTD